MSENVSPARHPGESHRERSVGRACDGGCWTERPLPCHACERITVHRFTGVRGSTGWPDEPLRSCVECGAGPRTIEWGTRGEFKLTETVPLPDKTVILGAIYFART